jgi:hypothetical protein
MRLKVSAIGMACGALLAACGGGGGGDSGSGGAVQSLTFEFPGGGLVGVPPTVTTVQLKATASSGGPVTFSSNTPKTCSVSGSTLSLLAAGECSVTATQSGYKGYATVSESQLFVIPKQPQVIAFPNPGAQPLDSTPVTLAATSSSGRPVTFSSKTPTICSVSGTTMTKLADGLCTVSATQDSTDIFLAAAVDKIIPIGSAQAPELTFLSAYKDGSPGIQTAEGGSVGHRGNWWWCQDCDMNFSADGSTLNFTGLTTDPSAARFWIHAGGLKADSSDQYKLVANGDTTVGLRVDAQGALRFKLAQNDEWFGSANNAVNVELILGHYNLDPSTNKACNVRVKATFKPTAAASTAYAIGLKDKFALSQSCGLTGLDVWSELQAYPISVIEFSAAAPISGGSKFTLTGPITFR